MHHPHQIRIGEQVAKLVLDVAEVDVDGDGPDLEAGEHGLQVLGPVVQVAADVVTGPDAPGRQVVGQAVGSPVELAVGEAPFTADHGFAVRDRVGDALEEIRHVEVHGSS
jgi:hypothetical protein